MFADITRICVNVEYTSGTSIWFNQGYAYNADPSWGKGKGDKGKGKGDSKGKGKGKGKGEKGKGKGSKGRAYEATTTDGRSKGKGGRNNDYQKIDNTPKPQKGICWAKRCGGNSGTYKFCSECFKQGMERGHITCYNGYRQELDGETRASRHDGKSSHHFDKEQMRGLSAVGKHLMDRAEEMIEARMADFGQGTNNMSAFQAQYPSPPAGPPPNPSQMRGYSGTVFKRLGTAAPEKESKRVKFMDELGKYEDE
jgi:hypothetical protein